MQAFLMAAAAAGGLAGVLVTHVAKPMHAKRLPPTYAEAAESEADKQQWIQLIQRVTRDHGHDRSKE